MTNVFPADLLQEIRDLKAAVQQLQTAGAKRSPLIEASAGWILRQMDTPSIPPSGDVHIYASGGRLRARSTLDDVALVDPPVAGSVADPAPPTSTTIGGTPSAANYNALRADYIALRATVLAALQALRDATMMLP